VSRNFPSFEDLMTDFARFMLMARHPAARTARWSALLGALIVLYFATGVYLSSPGPTDLGFAHLAHYVAVPGLFVLSAVALVAYGLPVSVIRALRATGRARWAHLGIVPGALVGLALVGSLPWTTRDLWEARLARAVTDQPLVAAIQRYEETHGRAAASLAEVVPADRAGSMRQTVRGCRPLSYSSETGSAEWSLVAECPAGLIVTLDQLVYRSDPAAPLEEHEVRVGRWRYHYD
jgi:hypothetical protein